jgi:hypothetical protein
LKILIGAVQQARLSIPFPYQERELLHSSTLRVEIRISG